VRARSAKGPPPSPVGWQGGELRRGLMRNKVPSGLGIQPLSTNDSAPIFSFGKNDGGQSTGLISRSSPGPVYRPNPTSKWIGDAPHAKFGSHRQRPDFISYSAERTNLEGRVLSPGPAAYGCASSMGKQSLTRNRSSGGFSFGPPSPLRQSRSQGTLPLGGRQRRAFGSGSPGPGSYCFQPLPKTPGPGRYETESSLYDQASSRNATLSSFSFGHANRQHPLVSESRRERNVVALIHRHQSPERRYHISYNDTKKY